MKLLLGDCVEEMAKLPEASMDAIVCDPPYGLEFMGKEWDRLGDVEHAKRGTLTNMLNQKGQPKFNTKAPAFDLSLSSSRAMQEWHYRWATEALRVLKPGGHLLAFGGTRTYHRLACAVEDAGFEIRDCISWMYGSGFPKSHNVERYADKLLTTGKNREIKRHGIGNLNGVFTEFGEKEEYEVQTEAAARWHGWGTALKPAHEPIVVARKPLAGTVAANVLEHGTGALNIDGTRVGVNVETWPNSRSYQRADVGAPSKGTQTTGDAPAGRWPANVALSHTEDCVLVGKKRVPGSNFMGHDEGRKNAVYGNDLRPRPAAGYASDDGTETVEAWDCVPDCPVRLLDEQSGEAKPKSGREGKRGGSGFGMFNDDKSASASGIWPEDPGGGASRFFYCAKTRRAERNAGLDGFEAKFAPTMGNGIEGKEHDPETATAKRNLHPTVKPVALMRWLVRLVTPPGGTVLDPFVGSGTTGIAAGLEGFEFVGIERDPDYFAIAEARIRFWSEHGEDGLRIVAEHDQAIRRREEIADAGQLDLFGAA